MSPIPCYRAPFQPPPTVLPEDRPQSGEWLPDILGAGFTAKSLALPRDDEGELSATLVRYLPADDPQVIPGTTQKPGFTFLYLHGWNDYFFQREMARHIALAGGQFFALDLSKYGRSWRAWQTFGWTDNLLSYDLDLGAAIEEINVLNPDLPFVLSGHSTGGLIASYWAKRHRDQLDSLVLTAPWIEMPKGVVQRKGVFTVGRLLGRKYAKRPMPGPEDPGTYQSSNTGWDTAVDGKLPVELQAWKDDPAISGWPLVPQWKGTSNAVIRLGWLGAIAAAQNQILDSKPLQVPTFFVTSTQSYFGKRCRKNMYADSVLNVETLGESAWRISNHLCLQRLCGKHDPTLSLPPHRQVFWAQLHQWMSSYVPGARDYRQIDQSAIHAICP